MTCTPVSLTYIQNILKCNLLYQKGTVKNREVTDSVLAVSGANEALVMAEWTILQATVRFHYLLQEHIP